MLVASSCKSKQWGQQSRAGKEARTPPSGVELCLRPLCSSPRRVGTGNTSSHRSCKATAAEGGSASRLLQKAERRRAEKLRAPALLRHLCFLWGRTGAAVDKKAAPKRCRAEKPSGLQKPCQGLQSVWGACCWMQSEKEYMCSSNVSLRAREEREANKLQCTVVIIFAARRAQAQLQHSHPTATNQACCICCLLPLLLPP